MAQGADYACGNRGLKLVGIADGDGHLAGPQLLRISQLNRLQVGGIDPDDGEIGGGIVAHCVGGHAAAVGERDLDAGGVVDDVAVGEDEAVGSKDETGAASTAFARFAGAGSAGDLVHFHVDDRRADFFNRVGDGARVGVKKQGVGGRAGCGVSRLVGANDWIWG